MIIDLILDRYDDEQFGIFEYNAHSFYADILGYRRAFPSLSDPITAAMDYGDENDVRAALADYINKGNYNPHIIKFIYARKWLENDGENAENDYTDIDITPPADSEQAQKFLQTVEQLKPQLAKDFAKAFAAIVHA